MPPETPTSLAAGIRLAHYEILSRLGTGGMGQVDRACAKIVLAKLTGGGK